LGHTRSVFVRRDVVAALVKFDSMRAGAHLN
jgi:hypothetical protein